MGKARGQPKKRPRLAAISRRPRGPGGVKLLRPNMTRASWQILADYSTRGSRRRPPRRGLQAAGPGRQVRSARPAMMWAAHIPSG